MAKILHRSAERGHVNHGWLNARHSFSFASYHDPSRVHFGLLRVLNDDIVAPGSGFGKHPHDNMEIVTIPLSGVLEHKDSMGNTGVIRPGEIQAMSAGSGLMHSEYNHSSTEPVNLLQIWVFPKLRNIPPRYDQRKYEEEKLKNTFHPIVGPEKRDDLMWINQDAWFSLGQFEPGTSATYKISRKENGAYFFIISGEATIDGQVLGEKDATGIWEQDTVKVSTSKDARILVIDVPMH